MANNTSLYGSNGNILPAGDNVIITGTLTVNGCAILTDCSAFNFLPFNANTLNIGLESTTLALGSTTGVTTVRNQLATNNYAFPVADGSANQVLVTDGSGNLSFANIGSLGIVTSITGTANQVIASSPTGAVTLSLPQDIATTSNPVFAGVTGGNIAVGVSTNNTISSTNTNGDIILQPNGNGDVSIAADTLFIGDGGANAFITTNGVGTLYINTNNGTNTGSLFIESGVNGNIVLEPFAGGTGAVKTYNDFVVDDDVLFVDVSTKRIGINNPTPQYELHIDQGLDGITQFAMTTNERTALWTINDGDDLLSLNYGVNPAPSANRLQFNPTDQWFNSGRLGVGTDTPAYELDVQGTGRFTSNLIATSGFTINGLTSGSSSFNQSATGSAISYTLPTSQGAASTVLTNDGSGNLSWALPGGGGSTFGNITIAVATDNTISTTTGNLVLASATNVIDASTAEVNVNVLTVDNRSSIETTLLTTTSVATIPIAGTARNVMKCVISVVDNVTGERQALEALALEKGTTAYLTTYAEMNSGVVLATFSADVSAGSLRLLATPTSTNSTTFNVVRTSLN